jgi:hypothetical protein
MKRFLKNVFAALKKNQTKSVLAPKRPTPMPALGVRSQVKAGQIEIQSFTF